jgi:6-phosphogluconolactonase
VTFAWDRGSGELTELARAPLAANTCYLELDRTERYLLQASYQGNCVTVNAIGDDGFVQTPPVQSLRTALHPHSVLVDGDNRFAIVPALGGDRILQYEFDARTGLLAPNRPAEVLAVPESGPRHGRFHPNRRFAYVLHEHDATVAVFDYDQIGGTLAEVQRLPALQVPAAKSVWAADLRITPDGRFLYATERGTSTIAIFHVDPTTGWLEPAGCVPTEKQPRALAIDPWGRWLLSTGEKSATMTVFAIEPATGALTVHERVKAGEGSHWIEILDEE